MITKENTSQLLGRSLTPNELANFDLYRSIAQSRLELLLCMNLSEAGETRTYDGRIGYRTQYVDPLTAVSSVTVNGQEIVAADYTLKLWENRNAQWFNIIEFKEHITGEVVVTAQWGFGSGCPVDLRLLLAKLFELNSTDQKDSRVKAKKIEDYSVTYKDTDTYEDLVSHYASVINKYSLCSRGSIRHGSI